MPDRVVDYLVRELAERGITHIFGVDGANIEDLYDAIFDADGHPAGIVAKHEFSAATMADGYARATGGLGVVAATSGGGAMNLVAGLAEAYASRVPVLALIGQPPTALEGAGAFQDSSGLAESIDARALFATVSRYCARVTDASAFPTQLATAITAAEAGGPAVLLLPKDVQQQHLSPPIHRATEGPTHAGGDGRFGSASLAAQRFAAEMDRAGTLVVIAGDQVARDNARPALAEFVSALGASIGLAPDAKDVYANTGPGYLGVAGSMGHPELLDALGSASACLLIGTRLPVTTRAGLESALADLPLLSIGTLPPHLPATHLTSTDLATTLTELLPHLPHTRTPPPAREPTPLPVPESDGPGLRYRTVVEAIQTALPDGTDVFADAGNTGASVVHHLRVPDGGRFVVALGMGGMGYAFGAGIGSAFARRDGPRRTVVVAGDGAFFMHGMEIHTAVEYDLPITFVVFNNNAHAMCVTREQLFYRDRYSFNRFRPAHIGAGIAAMFPGLVTHTVEDAADLTEALRRGMATPGPSFLEILCDPDEIPPFHPFLSTIESARRTS
ncbi:thiamine pyrophosphate-binding protein [Nocardia sp. AG03]|uniref:thiamine pyrophosphate-binding protein n=1 Tax=Nocardia sp. AG03 TaxID=3025312 RepID=UPI0024189994|nr:thiamine pyrophosphate-binding protein [Nocardia sp. AG03]